jgi:putative restriction endonuclease
LLLLYALAEFQQNRRVLPFRQVDEHLRALFKQVGSHSPHSEYPFWRLQADGIWEVKAAAPLVPRKGHSDPKRKELLDKDAKGSFPAEIRSALEQDPKLLKAAARIVLELYFAPPVRAKVAKAAGLSL